MAQNSVFSFQSPSQPLVRQLTGAFIISGSLYDRLIMVGLVVAAICALALSAQIQIPFYPVPVTMQTLIILMIGMSYGARLAGVSVLGYLGAGALGYPVFAGGGGGLASFAGPTGGYLIGFFVAAVVMGVLSERGWTRNWQTTFIAMLIGNLVIFAMGLFWLSGFVGGFEKALIFGLYPFLIGDILKVVIATATMPFLWRLVQRLTSGE